MSFAKRLSNTLSAPKDVSAGICCIRGKPNGSLAYPGRLCVLTTVTRTPFVVTLSLPLGLKNIVHNYKSVKQKGLAIKMYMFMLVIGIA